ncbi:13458_t:CDS:2, partial [Cetraspora pellucida]
LLTLFGAFIRGLLFSGIGGSSASKIAGKMNKSGKKDGGSKKIVLNIVMVMENGYLDVENYLFG